jgi:hypothetical protein
MQRDHGYVQQHRARTHLNIGPAGAILRGLAGPLGSTANPPQTKPGRSIPRRNAQFARNTCLEM